MSTVVWKHRDSFDHRNFDVYLLALDFYSDARKLCGRLRRPDVVVRNQFLRAALSICANIAEGSGELKPKEKGRFYRIAKRSGTECACMLDAIDIALNLGPDKLDPLYHKLRRIITMLIALDKKMAARTAAEKNQRPKK